MAVVVVQNRLDHSLYGTGFPDEKAEAVANHKLDIPFLLTVHVACQNQGLMKDQNLHDCCGSCLTNHEVRHVHEFVHLIGKTVDGHSTLGMPPCDSAGIGFERCRIATDHGDLVVQTRLYKVFENPRTVGEAFATSCDEHKSFLRIESKAFLEF
ncbi:MAG: hypothetical protein EA383_00340 [Spirochaetaceae bacterium]|nr:MAG: hypothetical protein EA383_00340 [Spirochaetaceae bacterium]